MYIRELPILLVKNTIFHIHVLVLINTMTFYRGSCSYDTIKIKELVEDFNHSDRVFASMAENAMHNLTCTGFI